jgi:hypothetical protein
MAKETYLRQKKPIYMVERDLSMYLWQKRSQLLVHLGHLHLLRRAKRNPFDTQGVRCSLLVLAMLHCCINHLPHTHTDTHMTEVREREREREGEREREREKREK